jgi:hypothetical protein
MRRISNRLAHQKLLLEIWLFVSLLVFALMHYYTHTQRSTVASLRMKQGAGLDDVIFSSSLDMVLTTTEL